MNGFRMEKNGDCFCCGVYIGNLKKDDSICCLKCENLYFKRFNPQKNLAKYFNSMIKKRD